MEWKVLDGIEKLINEHGSAVILKERIVLAQDQYAVLERKLADATNLVKELEAKHNPLMVENRSLMERVRYLEKQLAERQGQRLNPVREKLLVTLASEGNRVPTELLAGPLGISMQLALYHLTEMEKENQVTAGLYADGRSPVWSIAQEGRAYLISRGLLS